MIFLPHYMWAENNKNNKNQIHLFYVIIVWWIQAFPNNNRSGTAIFFVYWYDRNFQMWTFQGREETFS